ncbi:DsbE family thiol:disulfide interchange protein [bacterium endosymbiont of Bathymodiolus sp. 5 South]|jgi:cytochrome c biogenesis protein CcmG/thiol:disulfide interchange protein DsbE|uniref:DsbE family thiol:disulfide interchange protein n=1 Tax=bacterium endosymbiont of Bathymodiolus sp. 5 South TaxID=1181670 RepID=UPI0010BB98BD|nr:DsbE family thiol:disulfide interchange protein [bacterium endosymbiont of Bathymodiolus sp. 5 South]CAC9660793.1 Cytochrome c-type biogenesis protein CcmG/DsbE, thiol:disulfide oxidoreductase [uncultured Gammaproteobacteria bacterium]SHN89462.1 Cytochrome c-type biogenesis protein CcmG/DsbE, thiol:disulfide oxidoreductase [bacterium endosymbiont of Bathymodiolus sp. 5 South]SSC09090.1 Cytochrome c-type biogenesis protein CcmG/DsbE, thiol:disulfide oxidoreductase [bacterium endosymbiont of Ba
MGKFIPLVVFVVLAWFLYDGLGHDTKKLPSPLIGKNFPNLEVEDFQTGKKYHLQDKLKNQVSLVNVWASWCVTCRAEHQMLNNIAKQDVVQIVGINYKDTKREGKYFLNRLGNPFDFIVFDEQGKLGLELGVYATPETFIVDNKGVIRFKRIGDITTRIWQEEMLPLIQQLKK